MGGADQVERMKEDKLRTLKKSLLYSYQSATAILPNQYEFRCLMNPSKQSLDHEEKIISIPFEDIPLNSSELKETNLKVGDVFEWKENGSHWLITLKKDEETAYFRAICRKCRYEIEINGQKYWVYVRGPVEQSILWSQANGNYFNNLNYTLVMYITKDSNTEEYFNRFSKIKINGDSWEVQAVDRLSSEGILEIALKESYNNAIEDENKEGQSPIKNQYEYIKGPSQVKPFDIITFYIEDIYEKGDWVLNTSKAKFIEKQPTKVIVEITSGRSGSFELEFIKKDLTREKKTIEIISL